MWNYGGGTPKRHVAYSNSKEVMGLEAGKLRPGWRHNDSSKKTCRLLYEYFLYTVYRCTIGGVHSPSCVRRYVDKSGKVRFQGTKQLKKTEPLDCSRCFCGEFENVGEYIYIYMSCSIVTVSILLTLAPRHYPVRFGFRIVEIFESLVENKSGQPAVVSGPVSMEDLFRSFQGLDWGKIWPEAEVGRVCKYMFGSKDLDIPPEFKVMVPRTI